MTSFPSVMSWMAASTESKEAVMSVMEGTRSDHGRVLSTKVLQRIRGYEVENARKQAQKRRLSAFRSRLPFFIGSGAAWVLLPCSSRTVRESVNRACVSGSIIGLFTVMQARLLNRSWKLA